MPTFRLLVYLAFVNLNIRNRWVRVPRGSNLRLALPDMPAFVFLLYNRGR